MDVKFVKPVSKNCPGQAATKYPPVGDMFIRDVKQHFNDNFSAFTVDGYIVNHHAEITRLFFKCEYVFAGDLTSAQGKLAFTTQLAEFAATPVKDDYSLLGSTLGCGVDFIFIPQGFPDQNEDQKIVMVSKEQAESSIAQLKSYSVEQFAAYIKKWRGFGFKRSKPLRSADTCLECYLANELRDSTGQANTFPGDIDLIIRDNQQFKAIVEFKTHNLPTPIIGEHYNKYLAEDDRRLRVLRSLSAHLKVNLFFVIWGPNHPDIKIQQISQQQETPMADVLMEKNSRQLAVWLKQQDQCSTGIGIR